jgi:hypothetical protein
VTDDQLRPRRKPFEPLIVWNLVLLIAALAQIPLSFDSGRFPLGMCMGILVLPFQICFGLIPTILRVHRGKLVGPVKRTLLWLAILGPIATVTAAIISCNSGGGC